MSALSVAQGQLAEGVVEEGENRGVPFARYALPGEEPAPWCARFMRFCFAEAGTPLPGNRWLIGSVVELFDALKTRGALVPLHEEPKPGDLILLHSRGQSDPGRGNHVGIVEEVRADAVVSIDGNWGDKVSRVTRRRGDPSIWCFARWPISPTA